MITHKKITSQICIGDTQFVLVVLIRVVQVVLVVQVWVVLVVLVWGLLVVLVIPCILHYLEYRKEKMKLDSR